jgi:hypothetical protein
VHRVVDDRVDADDEVVGGDDGLRREGHDLLAQVDVGAHLVDERDEEVHAVVQGPAVATQSLDDLRGLLRDDPDGPDDDDQREDDEQCDDDESDDAAVHGISLLSLAPGPVRPEVDAVV